MRKLWIMVLLVLSVALLVSCGGPAKPEEQPENEESAPTPEDVAPFVLRDDLLIVRGELAEEAEKKAAVALRAGIAEKTGKMPAISTDWTNDKENPELAEYEILVGRTNREISHAEGLDMGDFIIRLVDGKKLVILGESPAATQTAVNYFLEN
jgi:hypothetical protein